MARESIIRQGQVYWLDHCDPLDDENVKRRPVIVVYVPALARVVVVVAVSTQARRDEPDLVPIPNLQDNPKTTSGLPRRCWAVPRWYLPVDRSRLTRPVGYVSGATLRKIVAAVAARMQADQDS